MSHANHHNPNDPPGPALDPVAEARKARDWATNTLVGVLAREPLRVSEFDAIDRAMIVANGSRGLLERADHEAAKMERELAEEERRARRVVKPYPTASLSERGIV